MCLTRSVFFCGDWGLKIKSPSSCTCLSSCCWAKGWELVKERDFRKTNPDVTSRWLSYIPVWKNMIVKLDHMPIWIGKKKNIKNCLSCHHRSADIEKSCHTLPFYYHSHWSIFSCLAIVLIEFFKTRKSIHPRNLQQNIFSNWSVLPIKSPKSIQFMWCINMLHQ